jgi:hypothetical protein
MISSAPKSIIRFVKISDILFSILIAFICVSIYGYRSGELGIYADDAGFLLSISKEMTASDLINSALGYVTGRNLHIVWHYLLTLLSGGNDLVNIAVMHHIAVFFDAVNACLLYLLLRTLKLAKIPSFIGSIFFIIFPNHGETHYWISALPMNIMSTFFSLILLIICSYLVLNKNYLPTKIIDRYLIFAFINFFLALFTYDQTAPLCLISLGTTIWIITKQRGFTKTSIPFLILLMSLVMICSWVAWKFVNPGGGPSISAINLDQILKNIIQSITIWISTFYSATNFFNINSEFIANNIFPLWFLLDNYERLASISVMLLLLISSIRLIETSHNTSKKWRSTVTPNTTALLFLSIILIILAYAPSYAWYISPRHNYLPSVGAALFLTVCVDKAFRSSSIFIKVFVTTTICFLGINFTASVLLDKHYWIESYSYRKSLYNEISVKTGLIHIDNLVLLNFLKKPYPSIPDFLMQAPADEIYFITNGKLGVSSIYLRDDENFSKSNLNPGQHSSNTIFVNCLDRIPAIGCK